MKSKVVDVMAELSEMRDRKIRKDLDYASNLMTVYNIVTDDTKVLYRNDLRPVDASTDGESLSLVYKYTNADEI